MKGFEETAAKLREYGAEWGVVLGSGLGDLVGAMEVLDVIPYSAIGGLPASRVQGHAGKFVVARRGEVTVILAQGRVHLYEGHDAWEVSAGVRFMAAAGMKRLVLTNAAGSLNRDCAPGTWMMLNDHLNLTGTSPLEGGPHFVDMSAVYSPRLREQFRTAAAGMEIMLHEGVYAGLRGPQYETPAEVRMLQKLGADAVGMSTVLEAIQARALEIEVAGFSCLTNWGAGLADSALHHQEVLDTGRQSADAFAKLLLAVISHP